MGLKGWHWSCWTLIHWYGNHEVSWRKQKMKLLFSWLLLLFQVGDLEAFLMMIPSNGECMRTSLAVLEGLCSMPCFPIGNMQIKSGSRETSYTSDISCSIFDLTTQLYPAYFLPLASLGNLTKVAYYASLL